VVANVCINFLPASFFFIISPTLFLSTPPFWGCLYFSVWLLWWHVLPINPATVYTHKKNMLRSRTTVSYNKKYAFAIRYASVLRFIRNFSGLWLLCCTLYTLLDTTFYINLLYMWVQWHDGFLCMWFILYIIWFHLFLFLFKSTSYISTRL
jgi:hypothetical protein